MSFLKQKRIFMDYASATPMLPEVLRAMSKYWASDFYNPSAIYGEGIKIKKELEEHRTSVARLLGIGKKDVVFTSGGTESDNLAIIGSFEEYRQEFPHRRPHLIISSIEHPAVIESAEEVKRRGGEVSVVEVNSKGLVSPKDISGLIKEETFMVSIMLANNELGTIEPVAKIGRLVLEYKKKEGGVWPLFHTDASQAFNFVPLNIGGLNVDLLTLDGSKIYGPKGIGCLVVRSSAKIRPIMVGGGQERGYRSGTENMPLIAGFVRALEIAASDREKESQRLEALQLYFIERVKREVPDAVVNTPIGEALPNIVNLSVPGASAEMMLLSMDRAGVMVSMGSACKGTSREEGSYVIRAIGKRDLAESSLRFSFGRFTKKSEINRAIGVFREATIRGKIQS